MVDFLLTIVIGSIFGLCFYKMEVPGGMMVGPIIGVVIFNILFQRAVMPYEAKIATQLISGAFIGVGISRDDLKQLKKLIKPVIILLSGMLLLNMLMGFIIYLVGPMDLKTAFFCAVPGGMTYTPIIATEMGADGAVVALMQFVRLCAGIGVFPSMISYLCKKESEVEKGDNAKDKPPYTHKGFFTAIVIATITGILGKFTGIPAGTLLGSLLGTIAIKQFYPKCMLPIWVRRVAQVLAGAYIATGFKTDDLSNFKLLIVPAIVMLLGYFGACIGIGYLIKKYGGLTAKEGMLAATPAGASDMALIAADIGVNSPDVIVLQISRMLSAIIIFPQVIMLVLHLLS